MKLIVGLGNPGSEYANTRHNCGFIAIDKFADKVGASFSMSGKLKGMIAQVNINGNKAILLKPMTYMNLSGESVQAVMSYYKIDKDDLLVISDDLDSKLGRVRLRAKGSAGGHNGHKNIIQMIGSDEYKRIKIGIDRDPNYSVIDWVLKKFNEDDLAVINQSTDLVCDAINDFINDVEFMKIASKYSSK